MTMTGNTRTPLLSVQNLSVSFGPAEKPAVAVQDLSFDLFAGETLAIVGESGSGKSVTALSILRLIEREGGRLDGGRIAFRLDDASVVDLAASSEAQLQRIRGNSISMIFQEPMTSLNPVLTIGDQICETLIHHKRLSPSQALREARDLLDRVRLSDPGRRLSQYPHELSGGMRQRVMIAMALACSPRLLIADEPTTALDVTIQAGILDLIRELQQTSGTAVVFITHDMGVVAEIADRVVVMRQGKMIETADTNALFSQPRADYTRELLNAVPKLGSGAPVYAKPKSAAGAEDRGHGAVPDDGIVLEVKNLVTRFPIHKGMLKRMVAQVHAVEDVSFTLRAGETLGLVGESGSGKSTIGRSVLKLIEPESGRILFGGKDLVPLTRRHMRPMRRDLQMIFQDPYASLNPRMTVAELVTEPLCIHTQLNQRERREIAAELLARVRLPLDSIDRYPHQFSADLHSPRAFIETEDHRRGRGRFGARCLGAGGSDRPAAGTAARRWHRLPFHLARHCSHRENEPPRGGPGPGPDCRDRCHGRGSATAAARLYATVAQRCSGRRSEPPPRERAGLAGRT